MITLSTGATSLVLTDHLVGEDGQRYFELSSRKKSVRPGTSPEPAPTRAVMEDINSRDETGKSLNVPGAQGPRQELSPSASFHMTGVAPTTAVDIGCDQLVAVACFSDCGIWRLPLRCGARPGNCRAGIPGCGSYPVARIAGT